MKRIALTFLAVISLAWVAAAATRPHYGGALRIAMQSAPTAFEMPDASSPIDYEDMARVLSLVADTLVNVDALGRPKPALAIAWQGDSTNRHWQFTLRHGVRFHDGSAASAALIAQILGAFHPDWTVRAVASSIAPDTLTIDTETPTPWLLAELALPRNFIFTRNNNGIPVGTGAFRVADFQSAKSLKLAANEDAWSGRPFLDAVEIEFGKSLRDQAVAMELGRADVIEAPSQSANGSSRVRTSLPVELMALAFSRNTKAQDVRLRQALALCIDRKPIQSVLLKGSAESTASILPNWMTGYSAAFSTEPNQQLAKSMLVESRQPSLTLSYDPRDPQAQLIAERIALNAREAGIVVQVSLSGADDIRLVRIALPSPDPALSLDEMAHQFSLPQPVLHGDTVDDLYQAEHVLLDRDMLIPLFHLPVGSAAGGRVRRWAPDQLGGWNLQDLWLEDSR